MQLQLVRETGETRQLDEIVSAFTPLMQRICRHMNHDALREMVERMALQQLADEQRRCAPSRRRTGRRTTAPFPTLHAC